MPPCKKQRRIRILQAEIASLKAELSALLSASPAALPAAPPATCPGCGRLFLPAGNWIAYDPATHSNPSWLQPDGIEPPL